MEKMNKNILRLALSSDVEDVREAALIVKMGCASCTCRRCNINCPVDTFDRETKKWVPRRAFIAKSPA
jgi:hypothetical protein